MSLHSKQNTIFVTSHAKGTDPFLYRSHFINQKTGEKQTSLWQSANDLRFEAEQGVIYDVIVERLNQTTGEMTSIKEASVSLAKLYQTVKRKPTQYSVTQLDSNNTDWNTAFALDADFFPLVNITADLAYQSKPFDGGESHYPLLEQSNVTIIEDQRTESIDRFVQPDPNSNRKIVDVVFVHDDSGSLDDEAAQVRANILSFVQGLADENFDFRLGLVPYGGDSFSSPSGTLTNNGSLTDDPSIFQDLIDQMRFDGYTEQAFDAINLAVSGSLWRPTTQKVVILITDEDNDPGSVSESAVIQTLQTNNVLFYGLTSGHSEFDRIAASVAGRVFDIQSNFSTILSEIGSDLSARYNIQYTSSNTVIDGVERTVQFNLDTVDYDSNAITGQFELTYTPIALLILN